MSINTNQVPDTTCFFVNNRNRSPHEDALAFSFQIPFLPELENATYAAAVDCVTFENALPLIASGINDQLWFEYNGVQDSLTFQEGNVTIYHLLTEIKTVLQLLNAGFDLSFDTLQFKLLLTIPAGVTFALLRVHPTPLDVLDYTLPDRTDRALELLGWTFDQTDRLEFLGGVSGYTWIPNNIVRVRHSAWLHLHCTEHIEQTHTSNPEEDGPLSRFPFIVAFGDLDHYQKVQPTGFTLANPSGLRIAFYVTDEWGVRRTCGTGRNMLLGFQMTLTKLGSF